MKILHLLASPYDSGPAEAVVGLALAQRALGHDVSVAADVTRTHAPSEALLAPRLDAEGLLDGGGLRLSVKSPPWELAADVARLRRREVDVVHAHFSHDHLLAWLGRPRGARLIRSLHAPRSLRRFMPPAEGWTVPYEALRARLQGKQVAVLPAVAAPRFQPAPDVASLRRSLGVEGAPVVGMVSTFKPSRRHELGLEAFAELLRRVPAARLLLVGDGALGPALRARVASLGLAGTVTFAGYQAGEAFVRWLQVMDEVWILGLGNDWAGRAAAEARACGVRVLAVEEGDLPRWADVVVRPAALDILAASVGGGRRHVEAAAAPDVARAVLSLYEGKP
ncbi:MAG: hypothetical protein RL653_468 [Pseudomonadota bacterium]|jgi:glycosyltransferase involved in cell wall biosynthesis